METEFKKSTDKTIQNNKLRNRKKIIIFSLCLLFSVFFWIVKKFSKEYQITLPIKIVYRNTPADKILISNNDTIIYATIKSQGFNLLYQQIFNPDKKINYDLTKHTITDNKTIIQISTSEFLNNIKREFNFKHEITKIYPDSFVLKWEKSFYKKVVVKPLLTIELKKQFQLYEKIKITPDSVLISGTNEALNKINYLITTPVSINNLSSSSTLYTDLIIPVFYPEILSFVKKIRIDIPVEKYTENEIEIPIKNENYHKFFPDKIKITYLVALKDYKKINQEQFVILANVKQNNGNKAEIEIVNSPQNIKIKKIYPEKVEFIIFK